MSGKYLELLSLNGTGAEPCFDHDCEKCIFIGVGRDLSNNERVDLYVCLKEDGNHSFIYRYGNDGPEYGSMPKSVISQRYHYEISDIYTGIMDIWEEFHDEILGKKPSFKQFVLAGKSIFTVHNDKGVHYTYKVQKQDEKGTWGVRWFVSLLTGPNNLSDYQYIGILEHMSGTIRLTRASCFTPDSLPVKVVNWALAKVVWPDRLDKLPPGYGIKHEGRCGRCGRVLTTPESIDQGIGPECLGKMGF